MYALHIQAQLKTNFIHAFCFRIGAHFENSIFYKEISELSFRSLSCHGYMKINQKMAFLFLGFRNKIMCLLEITYMNIAKGMREN